MRSRILTFLTIVVVLFFMPKRLLAQDRPAPIVEACRRSERFSRRGLGLLHHGRRRCPLVRHAADGSTSSRHSGSVRCTAKPFERTRWESPVG